MTDDTGAGLVGLRGTALVKALERMDPGALELRSLDVNTLASAIDPTELGKDDFRRLLAVLDKVAANVPELDLSKVEPRHFAGLVAKASQDQLDRVVAEPRLRARLLDEIFDRMKAHIKPDRGRDLHAVVHWWLTGGSDEDGYDRYETVLRDGDCTVRRELTEKPRVTITIGPTDFLRLITHQATPAVLFVTGKIKVKGDLAFAASMIGFFDLPKP
ncbi:SCP2 sterol-binding domain-containing protein [Amycolatopsis nigrescens]|uniref:SCP2 sterol-binding domain-containing protein n=1 Tax=Amycolatopsis nigrescens TaxID=381445 RepID=UPI000381177C|nr:SCP2 sterol-binding domain-containing protein [Amycolatopsis nigrescens]